MVLGAHGVGEHGGDQEYGAAAAGARDAAAEGLELLAAGGQLTRRCALAALRVLWNIEVAAAWDAAVARALATGFRVPDVLLAADGVGSAASPDERELLEAVDVLCGQGHPDDVRSRVSLRVGPAAWAAVEAIAARRGDGGHAGDGRPREVLYTDHDSGWLRASLLATSIAAAGRP